MSSSTCARSVRVDDKPLLSVNNKVARGCGAWVFRSRSQLVVFCFFYFHVACVGKEGLSFHCGFLGLSPERSLLKGGGTRARSKGEDLRSSGEGLRGFKSHPPHQYCKSCREFARLICYGVLEKQGPLCL